jgi:hypothetical protein
MLELFLQGLKKKAKKKRENIASAVPAGIKAKRQKENV